MPKICVETADKFSDHNSTQVQNVINASAEIKTPVNQPESKNLIGSSKLSVPTLKNLNIPSTSTASIESASDIMYQVPESEKIESNRQLTTSMSPTKSLLGKRLGAQTLNLDNLNKIKQIHQPQNPYKKHHVNIFKNASKFFANDSTESSAPQASSIFLPFVHPKNSRSSVNVTRNQFSSNADQVTKVSIENFTDKKPKIKDEENIIPPIKIKKK